MARLGYSVFRILLLLISWYGVLSPIRGEIIMKSLTASDLRSLTRLAASLPKGDGLRRAVLAGLKSSSVPRVSGQNEVVYVKVMGKEIGIRVEKLSSDSVRLGRGDNVSFLQSIGMGRWEEVNEHGAWVRNHDSLDEAIKNFARVSV